MAKNYLIGIGGTGARVIEAAVFMCAAGYGPEELSIFLIDPDKGNGNLARTSNLIDLYKDCKKGFESIKDKEGRYRVDLFKTKINAPNPLVWSIFEDQNTTLGYYINYPTMKQTNKDLSDFASVLFSEEELNTTLNEGFRGHPSIGAVVMANPPEDRDPWKTFFSDIAVQKPYDVRVFLVGSIFGGTGAAGVPTIGSRELIKFHPKAKMGDKSSVLLGGALVLPYFKFDDGKAPDGMYVTHEDFPIATKSALQYYNEKKEDLGFDRFYFIGDSLGQNVGRFSHGKKEQENRPHYIEMVSGLAAYDFFEQPEIKDIPQKQYFIAKREDERIRWDSLPTAHDPAFISGRQIEIKSKIITMTAFAYALSTYAYRDKKDGKDEGGILDREHKKVTDGWYGRHFKADTLRSGENKTILDNFHRFSKFFLKWICSIDDESNRVVLIDKKKIIDGAIETGEEIRLLSDNKSGGLHEFNIGDLLKVKDKPDKPQTFSSFISRALNQVDVSKENISDAAKFIHIFYEGALKFCKENYNIGK